MWIEICLTCIFCCRWSIFSHCCLFMDSADTDSLIFSHSCSFSSDFGLHQHLREIYSSSVAKFSTIKLQVDSSCMGIIVVMHFSDYNQIVLAYISQSVHPDTHNYLSHSHLQAIKSPRTHTGTGITHKTRQRKTFATQGFLAVRWPWITMNFLICPERKSLVVLV